MMVSMDHNVETEFRGLPQANQRPMEETWKYADHNLLMVSVTCLIFGQCLIIFINTTFFFYNFFFLFLKGATQILICV